MTDAIIIQVADAIVEAIRAIVLSEDFTVRRSYGDWNDTIENVDGLMVDVVPAMFPSTLFTRGSLRYICTVNVLLRRRLGEDARIRSGERFDQGRFENAAIDPYVNDLQTIHEYFAPSQPGKAGRQLASLPDAAWQQESANRSTFHRQLLREFGQFSGWNALVYSVSRAAGS